MVLCQAVAIPPLRGRELRRADDDLGESDAGRGAKSLDVHMYAGTQSKHQTGVVSIHHQITSRKQDLSGRRDRGGHLPQRCSISVARRSLSAVSVPNEVPLKQAETPPGRTGNRNTQASRISKSRSHLKEEAGVGAVGDVYLVIRTDSDSKEQKE